MRKTRRTLAIILATVVSLVAVLMSLPAIVEALPGASRITVTTPYALVIALRIPMAIGFAALALITLTVAAIRSHLLHRGKVLAAMGTVLALCAGLNVAVVIQRGISNSSGTLGTDFGVSAEGPGDGSVTVLSWNILAGATNVQEVATTVVSQGVDVIALIECSTARGEAIREQLAAQGLEFSLFSNKVEDYVSEYHSTVVLVADYLGEYLPMDLTDLRHAMRTDLPSPVPTETNKEDGSDGAHPDGEKTDGHPTDPEEFVDYIALSGTVGVRPASGQGPAIIAVHTISPAGSSNLPFWAHGQEVLAGLCTGQVQPQLILAGDFNATLDHHYLRTIDGCHDASVEGGVGGLGTWPTRLPALVGSPIDHVFVNKADWQVVETTLVRAGQSDHRGILTRLKPIHSSS